jgi:hypothetical protein
VELLGDSSEEGGRGDEEVKGGLRGSPNNPLSSINFIIFSKG